MKKKINTNKIVKENDRNNELNKLKTELRNDIKNNKNNEELKRRIINLVE